MFRRTKSADQPGSESRPPKEGGKGRPTPSRREAEAAAKARAKPPKTRREAAKLDRQRRAVETAKAREAMKSGDDKYLPKRDRGPVRRFVRDRVDVRLCLAEALLPLLLLIMVLSYSGNPTLQTYGTSLWGVTLLMVGADTILLVYLVRRDVRKRFPDEGVKGVGLYAVLRAMQIRFLRLPKPQVKLGQKLPERY